MTRLKSIFIIAFFALPFLVSGQTKSKTIYKGSGLIQLIRDTDLKTDKEEYTLMFLAKSTAYEGLFRQTWSVFSHVPKEEAIKDLTYLRDFLVKQDVGTSDRYKNIRISVEKVVGVKQLSLSKGTYETGETTKGQLNKMIGKLDF